MQIIPDNIVKQYQNNIINIHHGFLPAFKGAKPYHQAYNKGVKIVGATAHYVTNKLDEGPIICQDTVQINHKHSIDDILVHDETDAFIGDMLSNFTASDTFPEPLGVLYCVERPTYDDLMVEQMKEAEKNTKGPKSVNDLLNAGDTWEVK